MPVRVPRVSTQSRFHCICSVSRTVGCHRRTNLQVLIDTHCSCIWKMQNHYYIGISAMQSKCMWTKTRGVETLVLSLVYAWLGEKLVRAHRMHFLRYSKSVIARLANVWIYFFVICSCSMSTQRFDFWYFFLASTNWGRSFMEKRT